MGPWLLDIESFEQVSQDETSRRLVLRMAQLYREVAANLRTLYTVAYQPQGDRVRGKWHEIKVEVANTDLTARTKPGYFVR